MDVTWGVVIFSSSFVSSRSHAWQCDLSPIRTVIVSHMDVCKNKFTYHLSDKLMDSDGDLFSGGASSVILRTRERAAHAASHMIVCCK